MVGELRPHMSHNVAKKVFLNTEYEPNMSGCYDLKGYNCDSSSRNSPVHRHTCFSSFLINQVKQSPTELRYPAITKYTLEEDKVAY